jgi:hypothetical protein
MHLKQDKIIKLGKFKKLFVTLAYYGK